MADRVHLIAPAGDCRNFFDRLAIDSVDALVSLVQDSIGPAVEVTADSTLMLAREDEAQGGRTDDAQRAADIEAALADDNVVALVALRGGAWLTRILPRIDFSVMDRRQHRVAVWGFSELTTLVNIVGAHPQGIGVYGMGPAFLSYGLKRYAERRLREGASIDRTPADWAAREFRPRIADFFESLGAMLRGTYSSIEIEAIAESDHVGDLSGAALFVGGNLTVLTTLIGTPYESAVHPDGRWLVLEDFNDKPERLDRFLAHLTLAGYFNRCKGLLLGDFHQGERDLLPIVLAMLEYHLPSNRRLPVLATRQVGHTWPMTPLPMHVPAEIVCAPSGGIRIVFAGPTLSPHGQA